MTFIFLFFNCAQSVVERCHSLQVKLLQKNFSCAVLLLISKLEYILLMSKDILLTKALLLMVPNMGSISIFMKTWIYVKDLPSLFQNIET